MKNSEMAEIVRKMWTNKEEYAEEFIDAIWKTIYYLTYKKVCNEQEAEDLTQDIILYLYNHIGELKIAEAFYAWMNMIIFSFCNRKMQKLGKKNSLSLDTDEMNDIVDDGEGPEDVMLSQEKQEYLIKLINRLSQNQKDVVFLFYYQQMPLTAIAEILDCSLDAVKNRLYTARKIMKDQLVKQKDVKLFNVGLASLLLWSFRQEEAAVCHGSIRAGLNLHKKPKAEAKNLGTKKIWIAAAVAIVICMGLIGMAVFQNKEPRQTNKTPSGQALNTEKNEVDQEDVQEELPSEADVPSAPEAAEPASPAADSEEPENLPTDPAINPVSERNDVVQAVKGRLYIHHLSGHIFRVYRINDSVSVPLHASQVNLTTMTDVTFGDDPENARYFTDITANTEDIASITLNRGIYYVIQQEDPSDQESVLAAPFLVSVPMRDPAAESGWLTDVHVYPKNENLSIKKSVGEEQVLYGTYHLLDSFPWTIDASVPNDIYVTSSENDTEVQKLETEARNRNMITYGIIDKLGTKFRYVDTRKEGDTNTPQPLTVYYLDESGQVVNGVIDPAYYNFTIDQENTLSVYFNYEGKKFLKEQGIKTIRIVFYTKLTIDSEEMGKPVYNDAAEMEFIDENGQKTSSYVINPPEVHTGKIKITKVDADNTKIHLQGAKFKIASSKENAEQGIFLKRLVAGTTSGELEDILAITDTDGTAVIEGLAYGNQGDSFDCNTANTKYYLAEVEAPYGYNQLTEIMEVTVEGGAGEYIAQVAVQNGKGILLKTSDTMDLFMTILGVMISGISILYSILSERKKIKKKI